MQAKYQIQNFDRIEQWSKGIFNYTDELHTLYIPTLKINSVNKIQFNKYSKQKHDVERE